MDFFPQFNWAVPTAFSEALSDCLFVQGDILYDDKRAYSAWNTQNLNYSIQVQTPERNRTIGTTFYQNWFSSVRLLLIDYRNNNSKTYIDSTQGRLYTFLWQGNLQVLDLKIPEPQPPLLLRDVRTLIKIAKIKVQQNSNLFVMPYDALNATAKEKSLRIKTCLKPYNFKTFDILLKDAGISECKVFPFAPTMSFRCYQINGLTETEVNSLLKEALNKITSKQNRFDLKRHGMLICQNI